MHDHKKQAWQRSNKPAAAQTPSSGLTRDVALAAAPAVLLLSLMVFLCCVRSGFAVIL